MTTTIKAGQIVRLKPERKPKAAPEFKETPRQIADLAPAEILSRFAGACPGVAGPQTLLRIAQEARGYQDRHESEPANPLATSRIDLVVISVFLVDVIGAEPRSIAAFLDYSDAWMTQALRFGRALIREHEATRRERRDRHHRVTKS